MDPIDNEPETMRNYQRYACLAQSLPIISGGGVTMQTQFCTQGETCAVKKSRPLKLNNTHDTHQFPRTLTLRALVSVRAGFGQGDEAMYLDSKKEGNQYGGIL